MDQILYKEGIIKGRSLIWDELLDIDGVKQKFENLEYSKLKIGSEYLQEKAAKRRGTFDEFSSKYQHIA